MTTTSTMNGGPAALRLSSDRIITAASRGAPRRRDAGHRGRLPHHRGLDAGARAARPARARPGGPRRGATVPDAPHPARRRPRGRLGDDRRSVPPPHPTARRAGRTGDDAGARAGSGALHLHPAQGPASRARSRARPPEPDRSVASLAAPRGDPDSDRRVGVLDGDAAGGPSAAGRRGPRGVALAHRPGDSPPRRARRRADRRGARLGAPGRRLAPAPRDPPRGPVRGPLRHRARRGPAGGCAHRLPALRTTARGAPGSGARPRAAIPPSCT